MIEISNLNFHNQTIKNIEIDGDVNNLKIQWTERKINIVIIKDCKIIKKRNK